MVAPASTAGEGGRGLTGASGADDKSASGALSSAAGTAAVSKPVLSSSSLFRFLGGPGPAGPDVYPCRATRWCWSAFASPSSYPGVDPLCVVVLSLAACTDAAPATTARRGLWGARGSRTGQAAQTGWCGRRRRKIRRARTQRSSSRRKALVLLDTVPVRARGCIRSALAGVAAEGGFQPFRRAGICSRAVSFHLD
jgi:hypothetical protein